VTALRVGEAWPGWVEAKVVAAHRALAAPTQDVAVLDEVTKLLTQVAGELADLAAGADNRTAAKLITARSDLSGHLLAAATLDAAGAPARASLTMLRRATEAVREGLEATYGARPGLLTTGA
jgi:hypothetical protein